MIAESVCKGAVELGTACGKCSKCRAAAERLEKWRAGIQANLLAQATAAASPASTACRACKGTGDDGDCGPDGTPVRVPCPACNGTGITAASQAQPAQQGEQASIERMKHDFPHLIEFYGKHALGSMLAPSCLCCGQSTKDRKIGIKHMELPGVVICEPCAQAARSAPRPVLTEDTKRLDWLERNKCIGISHEWQGDDDYLWCVYRVGGSPNDRDIKHAGEADTLRAAIDAAIERAVRDGGGNNG